MKLMNELILTIILFTGIAGVFILPLIFLWDLIAFIIYIAAPKAKAEKRKEARSGFITSSVALIISVTFMALIYGILMLVYALI